MTASEPSKEPGFDQLLDADRSGSKRGKQRAKPAQRSADDASDKPKRALAGGRLVAVIAGVAALSLMAGIAIMQFIVSPADIAARTAPPDAGPVTAPIELRKIENTVLTRGEVTYADSVALEIDAGGGESRPVITGRVPDVGTILEPGSVALEVAGRPVIVLPGELPAYRTLRAGMRGPDVLQLKQALASLGYGVGDVNSDYFDYQLSAAIAALYQQLGYAPADGGSEGRKAVREAEQALQALLDAPERDAAAIQDARVDLATAQEAALTYMPSSEVAYLSNLPRRVDETRVKRGDILSGSPMTVSGATLSVSGTVSKQDAELLYEGMPAHFSHEGKDYTAVLSKITAPGSGSDAAQGSEQSSGSGSGTGSGSGGAKSSNRYKLEFIPQDLTEEDVTALRGVSVRLKIPIAATEGEVLAVPLAALSAGSGGENRVEVLLKAKTGKDAETVTITVATGLAADGYVEISSTDERIKEGQKVVVGR